jgi:CRISPR/Cas system-associated exonuclease Cas4 (RecB family)
MLPEPINHTVAAIDRACGARARRSDSLGVAMSQAASPCQRALWYALRWVAEPERIDGRKKRIFDTGFAYEDRLLEYLWQAGVDVADKQERVALADGWLRGKIDGTALGVPEAPKTKHVVECKSHGAESFKQLAKVGVKAAKPDHWAQCQLYMHALSLSRALYLAVNKNDDALYAERVEYDAMFCLATEERVRAVVASDKPPPRVEGYWCSFCRAAEQCLRGAWARTNCRTCLHAELRPGAILHCAKHDAERTYAQQQEGCGDHRYLPGLVPGEQIDVRGDLIVYRLADGSEWEDGR